VARRESLASDSAACASVGEPRPLRQIKRSAHWAGLFSFCEAKMGSGESRLRRCGRVLFAPPIPKPA